jgi:hypothetical protein
LVIGYWLLDIGYFFGYEMPTIKPDIPGVHLAPEIQTKKSQETRFSKT